MRARPSTELAIMIVLSLLLIVIIVALPSNPLRIVLGVPFALLFPGYALVAALFPSKSDLGGVERLALSLGLSIAVIPLIGLILNYTPWGIALYPILTALVIFVAAVSAIASYRQQRLPADERFSLGLNASLPEWATLRTRDRARPCSGGVDTGSARYGNVRCDDSPDGRAIQGVLCPGSRWHGQRLSR